jgi:hypothetical protein
MKTTMQPCCRSLMMVCGPIRGADPSARTHRDAAIETNRNHTGRFRTGLTNRERGPDRDADGAPLWRIPNYSRPSGSMFAHRLMGRMVGLQKAFKLTNIFVASGDLAPSAGQIQKFSFGRPVGFNCGKPFGFRRAVQARSNKLGEGLTHIPSAATRCRHHYAPVGTTKLRYVKKHPAYFALKVQSSMGFAYTRTSGRSNERAQ